jgi:hypothetical protein
MARYFFNHWDDIPMNNHKLFEVSTKEKFLQNDLFPASRHEQHLNALSMSHQRIGNEMCTCMSTVCYL